MGPILGLILVSVLFLAYSNGANDNFKGVATLLGSRTCTYRTALIWATTTIGWRKPNSRIELATASTALSLTRGFWT